MTEQWTEFQMRDIPEHIVTVLAQRARRQTVEKYGADRRPIALRLFERAEQAVADGHIILTMHNGGSVFDNGEWRPVYLEWCAHCQADGQQLVCWHKIAVAFADLLARHTPARPARSTLGRYHGNPPPRRRARKKRTQGHCPLCGGWLDSAGGCNKCGGQ